MVAEASSYAQESCPNVKIIREDEDVHFRMFAKWTNYAYSENS